MFEHDHLVAAKVLKVKMMMAFRILDDLCQEQYVKRWHCGDVNREAYELAKSMASKEVKNRDFYYFYTKPVQNQAIFDKNYFRRKLQWCPDQVHFVCHRKKVP